MSNNKVLINAFHPDYVKTYNPEFIEYFRQLTTQKKVSDTMTRFVNKARKTNKNYGTIHGVKEDSK